MILIRLAMALAVATSGISHAYLYVHGYQHIPMIGPAFLVQAGVSFALALLILIGGPGWLQWAAAGLAGGALVAFALSRTVGLFGFSETGWEPAPHAAISVIAEVLTVALWAVYVFGLRRSRRISNSRNEPQANAPAPTSAR
ncbi:hypothetical protein A5658_11255 [Mycobacterium sp. 1245111.1]|uniref:hypothetical protein n=1 Tax=Mycobacterium sp. 1245111.1 TaxID=1834073 RepID=UPI0007FBB159|nr:hypothetical protein [Mycobacterium sp. 1245111.1]OBK34340.1 hypothetical protein A5658_11255 [Mycobacterium sp. 1245111.1]